MGSARHFSKAGKKQAAQWRTQVEQERQAEYVRDFRQQKNPSSEDSAPGGQIDDTFGVQDKKDQFGNLYRPYIESLYKESEIQTKDMDLQQIMMQLNKKVIDYDKVYSFMTR